MSHNDVTEADVGVVTIFYNRSCSKSRDAVGTLQEQSVEFVLVEYLDTPPSRQTLELLISKLVDPVAELVRTSDARFLGLGLDPDAYQTSEAVLGLLLVHPELMQRPILMNHDRAVIARSGAKLDQFLG